MPEVMFDEPKNYNGHIVMIKENACVYCTNIIHVENSCIQYTETNVVS